MKKIFIILFCLTFCFPVMAANTARLDAKNSVIQFKTIKDGGVEVPGNFKELEGAFTLVDSSCEDHQEKKSCCHSKKSKNVETCPRVRDVTGVLIVNLDSVNTQNSVRDANIRNYFFQTHKGEEFQKARFELSALKIGAGISEEETTMQLQGTLTMHGKSAKITIPATVVRKKGNIFVKTLHPVPLDFKRWGLTHPMKELMKVCGHKSLKDEAELSFNLVFKALPTRLKVL